VGRRDLGPERFVWRDQCTSREYESAGKAAVARLRRNLDAELPAPGEATADDHDAGAGVVRIDSQVLAIASCAYDARMLVEVPTRLERLQVAADSAGREQHQVEAAGCGVERVRQPGEEFGAQRGGKVAGR
jgi:hypothetical protein